MALAGFELIFKSVIVIAERCTFISSFCVVPTTVVIEDIQPPVGQVTGGTSSIA